MRYAKALALVAAISLIFPTAQAASPKTKTLDAPVDIHINEFPKAFLEAARENGHELTFFQNKDDCMLEKQSFLCKWRADAGVVVGGWKDGDKVNVIEIWTGEKGYDVNTTPQVFLNACAAAISLAAPNWSKSDVMQLAKQLTTPKGGRVEIPAGRVTFVGKREAPGVGKFGGPPIWFCYVLKS